MASQQALAEPRARRRSSGSLAPQNGDVIIAATTTPKEGFRLRQLPCAAQFTFARRDAATQLARRFAERHGVDVWMDEGTYTLLVSFRRGKM